MELLVLNSNVIGVLMFCDKSTVFWDMMPRGLVVASQKAVFFIVTVLVTRDLNVV
jgi:hypothetical protein